MTKDSVICPVCLEDVTMGSECCPEPSGPAHNMSVDTMSMRDCKEVMETGSIGDKIDAWAVWCKLWDIQQAIGIADNEYTL